MVTFSPVHLFRKEISKYPFCSNLRTQKPASETYTTASLALGGEKPAAPLGAAGSEKSSHFRSLTMDVEHQKVTLAPTPALHELDRERKSAPPFT